MAWIEPDAIFDPDMLGLPIIGIASKLTKHDSGAHQHKMGQLLFAQNGSIRITLFNKLCMLPPTRIAWIPPNTMHRAEMGNVVGYRSLYFDTTIFSSLPKEIAVLDVNPLLRALLERIAMSHFDTDWQQGSAFNLLAVCIDEINQANHEPMLLRLPSDRRLSHFSWHELPPLLNILANQVGASEKTISRIFMKETGLNYQAWRQQWRFLRSIELLSIQNNISFIASELGFASDSAFILFFKKMSGSTPRTYIPISKISECFID